MNRTEMSAFRTLSPRGLPTTAVWAAMFRMIGERMLPSSWPKGRSICRQTLRLSVTVAFWKGISG